MPDGGGAGAAQEAGVAGMATIRPATPADMAGLTALYNDVIATSTAIFNDTPVTVADRLGWFEARTKAGYPVLVAEAGGRVAGFASFGDFRVRPGYRFSVEHSIHVHEDFRGEGLGRGLMEALFPIAAGMGKHVMVAGVDAGNAGSLTFHERLGFVHAGCLREVGHKFGRWLDLVFMQKFLDAPGTER